MSSELTHELSQNFIEYAVAVNSDRAIPDAKSGLKPVARRILFGALTNRYTSNKAHVKCAKIVGDVMGQFHPHGDSSIYGALVRLAQPWVMRYPLIDFHGNMGNIGGDGPAAYRYTEARLNKLSEQGMLAELDTENVDFIPNYDETRTEPITLPAVFPNLLCNPNSGIGVAMRCSWAPHNLKEVSDAIIAYLNGEEPMLPGPDFPTGGIIINKSDIPAIMKTGHGSVKIRGKYHVEKQNIVFTEIPYGTTIEGLITEIGEVADKKEIDGIEEARNESSKKGLRLVIECERGVRPETVAQKLFQKTDLQTSFSYNQVALVDKTPTELNLKDCIKIYIEHNIDCLVRECKYKLNEINERIEVVEGLLKALEDIDNIIALIRASADSNAAKAELIRRYRFTERQAKAILAMRLSSLAKLEAVELNDEHMDLLDKQSKMNAIINSEVEQIKIIKERLADIVKKFGDARRTEIIQIDTPKENKEIAEVVPEEVVVVVTQTGYIKRVPKNAFKAQKRRGKGIKTIDDAILTTISTNTVDTLMIFTNKGRMYRLLVDKVPVGAQTIKGHPLLALVNMEPDEKVAAVTSLYRKTNAEFVIFFTKNGLVKKTPLSEYTSGRKNTGVQAIKFKESDDCVVAVTFVKDEDLMMVTKKGYSIHFTSTDINSVGKLAAGVKGINLTEDDEVVYGLPIKPNKFLAVITVRGIGKLVPIKEFAVQGRGGRGVTIGCNHSGGDAVAGVALVDLSDTLFIVGEPNSITVTSTEFPQLTRTSMGNMMIKDSTVTAMIKL